MISKEANWLITLATAITIAQSAAAQSAAEINAAAQFVVGNCYRSIDDISRVSSTASMLKWQLMPPEMINASKPVEADYYTGWIAKDAGQTFLVGVSRGKVNGKFGQTCNVVANHSPQTIVPMVLQNLKGAKFVRQEQDGFQISAEYQLDHPTEPNASLHIVRAIDDKSPVTFSFLSIK